METLKNTLNTHKTRKTNQQTSKHIKNTQPKTTMKVNPHTQDNITLWALVQFGTPTHTYKYITTNTPYKYIAK